MTQADGWYPDPAGAADTFRWWGDAAWTRFLSTDPGAPRPTEAAVSEPDVSEPDVSHLDVSAQSVPELRPEPDPVDVHDEPRIRLAVAVGSVVAVLLVAIVAVGAVVTASTRQLPEGPAASPAPAPTVTVVYDADTRKAQLAEVSVTMPAAPYTCESDQALTPTFSIATICNAPVFVDYQGSEDWYAGLGFGLLSEDLEVDGDLRATTRKVFDSLQTQFYSGEDTTARNFLDQQLPDVPTTRAVALAGELHYDIDGLEPRFDKVLIIVVKLETGGYAAWFSARPDGAPDTTLESLNASLNSFVITR